MKKFDKKCEPTEDYFAFATFRKQSLNASAPLSSYYRFRVQRRAARLRLRRDGLTHFGRRGNSLGRAPVLPCANALIHRPISSNRATIAAREPTFNFAKIRRRCVHTVPPLMFKTPAITFLGWPCATIRTIPRSRGLSEILNSAVAASPCGSCAHAHCARTESQLPVGICQCAVG